ncbi:hypothetical protein MA9V1_031 [Chryseobacterium phage MA9V-1]|nr:hypothetical protein MA9V1_031 [Chryseobacterium phage MA9V-1]
MITNRDSLHKFKVQNFNDSNYNIPKNRFEQVLYRLVPEYIFKAENKLTSLFSNGLALMATLLTGLIEYNEHYFENHERRFNNK